MKSTKYHIGWIISLLVVALYSCDKETTRLEYALQVAGNNRAELEKVLTHYSRNAGDRLKYKAAVFLIENMPGHYSYGGPYLRGFKKAVDSTAKDYLMKKIILMQPARYPRSRGQLQIEPDVEHVTAEYLIRHIDKAFQQWTTLPWLEGTTFNDFAEYLLPYRIGNETLDYWRDSLDEYQAKRLQDAMQFFDDQKYSPYNLGQQLVGHSLGYKINSNHVAYIPVNTSECVFSSRVQLLAFRMAGIPAAIDHVPYWADMNGSHEWTTIIDPKKLDILPGQLESKNAPKVFRRTYSLNPVPVPTGDEYIPPFFTDPYNRDVTRKYQAASDVNVTPELATGTKDIRHVYLAVFNGGKLKEVAWSVTSRNGAVFRDMGHNIIYFPLFYECDVQKNYAYPVILHANGTTSTLQPDKQHVQTLRLTRKYPLHSNKVYHGNMLIGASFRCSNDPTFATSVTVHEVKENPNMYPVIIPLDTTLKCRYWQFYHRKMAELAEWICIDNRGNILTGKAIDPIGEGARFDKIFDGDPLTYGRLSRRFIIDFGHPVSLSKLIYLPRNDANGIYPGNEYELLYYDREGWQSAGNQIATDYEVSFESVPTNTVYWLRNLTTGKEERIFTMQNGKQRFW